MSKSSWMLPAAIGGAVAAPFLFPTVGAGLAGAGAAQSFAGPASALAGDLFLPVGGGALANMGPTAALGAAINPAAMTGMASGLGGAFGTAGLRGLGQLGSSALGSMNPMSAMQLFSPGQQQQMPVPGAAPIPAQQRQLGGAAPEMDSAGAVARGGYQPFPSDIGTAHLLASRQNPYMGTGTVIRRQRPGG